MEPTIIYYHSADNDGRLSAILVKQLLANGPVEYRPINYGQPFNYEEAAGRKVYMVDFTLQPFDRMLYLNSICDLTWIDHHVSEIKHEEAHPDVKIKGLRDPAYAACSLVWQYHYGRSIMDTCTPFIVDLVAYDDLRQNHMHPSSLPFRYGSMLWETDPAISESFWKSVLKGALEWEEVVNAGSICLRFEDAMNKFYSRNATFCINFEGLRFIVCNRLFVTSKFFQSVFDPDKYDACMSFGFRDGQFSVHMYHDAEPGPDLSAIAVKHGGGGHRNAAAFQCDELPFRLPHRIDR